MSTADSMRLACPQCSKALRVGSHVSDTTKGTKLFGGLCAGLTPKEQQAVIGAVGLSQACIYKEILILG
jgi:hypothetical protein